MYRTLGENYNERVLPSIIHETLKTVAAQYSASQLITNREAVSRQIRENLTERSKNFYIALDVVSITSLSFGKVFTHAIEAKQVAAHAKFLVEKAEQDKRSAIIRALVLVNDILRYGYNAATEKYKDLMAASIIDPTNAQGSTPSVP